MIKKRFLSVVLIFSSFLLASWTWAAAVDVLEFDEPEQALRYKEMVETLRCPKCLNTNLAGSDGAIAADLRAEIYDQIIEGQSDEEILGFMTDRYGDFITYRPPLNTGTLFLWFGPGLLLLAGFVIVLRMMKNSQTESSDTSLSDDEEKKLQDILSSHSDNERDS